MNIIMEGIKNFILLIRPIMIAFAIAYILNRPMQWIERCLNNGVNDYLKESYRQDPNA